MMITGGSPTMHPALMEELTLFAIRRGIVTTIETEGSHFIEKSMPFDLVSKSPKFSNSIPRLGALTPQGAVVDQKMIDQHNKFRLHKENIAKMMKYHHNYHYKPVWDGTPENIKEIQDFCVELGIP
jgi:7-carboxy-7-deazaguanine synthase